MGTMIEEWRIIPTAKKYEVSSTGRVRRSQPYRSTRVGRILGVNTDAHGYQSTAISFDGIGTKSAQIHRLVLLAFVGLPPTPKHVAAHWNGQRSDNRPENLRWATPRENTQDKRRHGTYQIGDGNPNSKLTEDDIQSNQMWKYALGSERRVRIIALLHQVTETAIRRILKGMSWSHLEFQL